MTSLLLAITLALVMIIYTLLTMRGVLERIEKVLEEQNVILDDENHHDNDTVPGPKKAGETHE